MKQITTLILFILSATNIVLAQEMYDFSARNIEPSRSRTIPYHSLSAAQKGVAGESRFVAQVEEPTVSKGEMTSSYTTHFALPVSWLNRQVILRVGYASTAYTVRVNGREVGFVPTGAMGAEFNITKASREGRNEISIVLDRTLPVNGIFAPKEMEVRGIEVFSQPTIRVRDVVVSTTLNANGDAVAEFALPVKCNALNRKSARLHYDLRLNDTTVVAEGYREISLDMRREDTVRFACVVPASMVWSAKSPTMLKLDVESRIDNRIAECLHREVGVRQAELRKGKFYLNGEEINLNLAEYDALKSLDEVQKYGYNGVIVTLNQEKVAAIVSECSKRGLYVVVRTPIDTTLLGDNIRRGGNPSNNPLWSENYLWCNNHTYHTVKGEPSVVGYAIAKGKTSGVNIYDTYVMLKTLCPNALVIYEGAKGEWATDK